MTLSFRLSQIPLALYHWLLVCLAFWCVTGVIQFGAEASPAWWDIAWYKQAVSQGEYWRLWSGHLQHLNSIHWLMNLGALSLIFAFAPCTMHPLRWLSCFIVAGGVIGWMLMDSQFDAYVGLSGVSYGLMIFGILVDRGLTPVLRFMALLLTVSKVVLEQVFPEMNNDTSQMIGGSVAIDAHLYGAITGALLAGVELIWRRLRLRRQEVSN